MKILSNIKYQELINNIKDYEKRLDDISRDKISLLEQITKLNNENYKLRNKIESYKANNNKIIRGMIDKIYERINMKLDYFDTSADEVNKLIEIYLKLKGDLDE